MQIRFNLSSRKEKEHKKLIKCLLEKKRINSLHRNIMCKYNENANSLVENF